MSTESPPAALDAAKLPAFVQAELDSPPLTRGSWVWTIGPAYAGVFIWVPLLDRLGTCLAGSTSLGWLVATAALACLACTFFLYDIPARWGWSTNRRLGVVAASTFGTTGSPWLAGVGVGVGSLACFAVSIGMALKLILLALISCGLVETHVLETSRIGSLVLLSPVFLLTAAFWILIIVLACKLRLAHVVFALMQVYTPVALMLLAVTALLVSNGLAGCAAVQESLARIDPPMKLRGGLSQTQLFQLLFGAFALPGLIGVDWGAAVARRRDVVIGGWIGILWAGSFCTTMALLTVAGAMGQSIDGALQPLNDPHVVPLSLHWAIFKGIGGVKAAAILCLLGLATLAPACYSEWTFRQRMSECWPALGAPFWNRTGGLLAFLAVATGLDEHLEEVFGLLGAVFAPAVGALVADCLRQRGLWHGVRRGWNPAGLLAWFLGVVVGLVPLLGPWLNWTRAERFQPASLFAFLTAAALYLLFAALGLERPLVALAQPVSPETD